MWPWGHRFLHSWASLLHHFTEDENEDQRSSVLPTVIHSVCGRAKTGSPASPAFSPPQDTVSNIYKSANVFMNSKTVWHILQVTLAWISDLYYLCCWVWDLVQNYDFNGVGGLSTDVSWQLLWNVEYESVSWSTEKWSDLPRITQSLCIWGRT